MQPPVHSPSRNHDVPDAADCAVNPHYSINPEKIKPGNKKTRQTAPIAQIFEKDQFLKAMDQFLYLFILIFIIFIEEYFFFLKNSLAFLKLHDILSNEDRVESF